MVYNLHGYHTLNFFMPIENSFLQHITSNERSVIKLTEIHKKLCHVFRADETQAKETIMSFKLAGIVMMSLTIPTSLASAETESSIIANAIALCKTNPACSYQASDAGSTVFRLKKSAYSKYVRCNRNGTCETHMPKGQKSAVPDMAALLAPN
jgi:hypothetical protein